MPPMKITISNVQEIDLARFAASLHNQTRTGILGRWFATVEITKEGEESTIKLVEAVPVIIGGDR